MEQNDMYIYILQKSSYLFVYDYNPVKNGTL